MRRFHKPGDEKRALVIVPQNEWDDWLNRNNPEYARSFLRHYPHELMRAWEFPVPPRAKTNALNVGTAGQEMAEPSKQMDSPVQIQLEL
jgi:putative SOS response-associated peptidase YedK